MSATSNRRIVLASRPQGEARPEHFRVETAPLPVPAEGQALLRTLYLSLDPYMRGRMNEGPSYAPPVAVGEVMVGGTVSEVVESRGASLRPGDIVTGFAGWQEYVVAEAAALRKLDPAAAPVTTALGVLGMPGLTAYTGLLNIGQPKQGETVVVAAASGAVGSIVGQIARIKGCRSVGIAGGPEKCGYVVRELGFDACIDHRSPTFADNLKAVCQSGIDVYFENVGGAVFEAVFPLLNPFARIPVCGLVSQYDGAQPPLIADPRPALLSAILTKRLTFRGFIVTDFAAQARDFARDMAGWLSDGKVKYREDIVDGFDAIVPSFLGLLKGKNFGKLIVRLKA